MSRIVIWNLFDSGNGSYNNVLENDDRFETFSIGLDIENKNSHFIHLDLSDLSHYFGSNYLLNKLNSLPKPDIITASPPCESWSMATNMKKGNACWQHMKDNEDSFKIRTFKDYDGTRYNGEKQTFNRINGELCIQNTIKIINHFNPKIYIIENPAYSRIWSYIEHIIGFKGDFENMTFYNNYGSVYKKPTKFLSNIDLKLNKENNKAKVSFNYSSGYNNRSDIPKELIKDIVNRIYEELKK